MIVAGIAFCALAPIDFVIELVGQCRLFQRLLQHHYSRFSALLADIVFVI